MPSSRAAILTPSPIRSPSASSTTSPRWTPMRNSMRRVGRHARVALDHAVLHLDRAAHRVDHAAELDEAAVAGALDDAPVDARRWRGRSDRCAAPAAAPACDPRPRRRAGCSRPRRRPGSQQSSGSRSFFRQAPALRRPSNTGGKIRRMRDHPISRSSLGLKAAGFRQGGARLVHFAFERVSGG